MAAYKALYRKYRPQYFADVIDQPQVTVTLKNELTRGRIAHAYLFTGSHGTGKTTCAKILARAVNCLHPVDGDPCGECEVCKGLEDGSILDVVEIDAASNNGVDSIRTLIEESNFTPTTAKYRVYIIDEVHMLSVAAFNALLKTLEEPPPHVIFILATTEVHKLLPTILSRCQRFDFTRIQPEAIAERLEWVAEQESAVLEHDAAMQIARVSDGAMRDALSLLDQCLGRAEYVTAEIVASTAGIAAREYLTELATAIVQQDCGGALERIDRLYQQAKDMPRLCEELAEFFRGLMLILTTRDAERLIGVAPQEFAEMQNLARQISLAQVLRSLDVLEEAMNRMRYANQRTQLEMAFVQLCSPELDTTMDALLRRIEALERGAVSAPSAPVTTEVPAVTVTPPVPQTPEPQKPTPEQPDPQPPTIPEGSPPVFETAPTPKETPPAPRTEKTAPPQPTSKPTSSVDIEALSANAVRFRDWEEVLKLFKGGAKSVEMSFANSAAYVSGEYMLIDATEFAFDLLKGREQRNRMREAILQVTGRAYKLGPYTRPKPPEEKDGLEVLTQRAVESGIAVTEENNDEELDEVPIPF